jgi:diguanylate cyclase (GGDEF)-like protein
VATHVYVVSVIVAGLAVLARALHAVHGPEPLGARPLVFVLFAVLLVVGELRPLEWFASRDGGEITASWTFSLGLILLAPSGTGMAVIAVVNALLELRVRKPLVRVLFNTAQVTLSIGAADAVLGALADREVLYSVAGPGPAWVGAVFFAGMTAVVLNALLTCIVLALSQQLSIVRVVREAATADWALDLLLVALTPVLLVVAARSFVVFPLLLSVVAGVYFSARIGWSHRHEATHDLLTGLPNRRMFFRQAEVSMKAAQAKHRQLAVLVVDLDGFKEINDRLGHAVGDLALRHVAARLTAHRRSTDIVARLGGDEFAILLGGAMDGELAGTLAAALRDSLREPLEVDGVPVHVGGSVGFALYPEHGEDIDTLLAHADAAMYQAKASRSGVGVYDGERDRNGPTRLGVLAELRTALDGDGDLFCVYQPKIDLRTGLVLGVEALVRWQHPSRGVLTAGHFMPVAEQTELMDQLTMRVLRDAVRQAVAWRARGFEVPVSINVSARNLMQYRFPEAVREVLVGHGLPPSLIELEITENTVTNDPVRAEVVLGMLKHLGVAISLDDFGTGYSSLAHLRGLPLDTVKIDRSFVKNLCGNRGDQVIVRSIIDLAANLDLHTVAEGVEDQATLERLRELGCESAQGFYLCVPTDADDVERQIVARAALAELRGLTEIGKVKEVGT